MLSKFISAVILSIGGALAISNIEQTKIQIDIKKIVFILALSVCTFFFSTVQFSVLRTTLMFIVMILTYKGLFNFDLKKSIIMTAIIMFFAAMIDAVSVLFIMTFVSKEIFRTNNLWLIMGNAYVILVLYFITKVQLISQKINIFVNNAVKNKVLIIITEIILSLLLVFLLTYNVYYNFQFNLNYIINLLIYLLIATILIIYIKEFNNYNKLLDEYDKLFEYVQTFEEWIEDEQLELHESKNSLSILYEKKNLKEVRSEIDKILNRKSSIEDSWVIDLKPLPKGGIKGLLYYKFMIVKNNNLNLVTDVSSKVSTKLKQLSKADMKLLCRLIGIYFDNAIEGALESKEKNISFEMYKIKSELNVVITNTYKKGLDITRIGEKGVSTKGKNRGKGTYLAKKLVSKNEKFIIKNSILNNYYIQKIIIQ